MKLIVEYVWLDVDGFPRSKARTLKGSNFDVTLNDIPEWNYDGSSTGQADGHNSEVIIKPCAIYNDPMRKYDGYVCKIVLCDTYTNTGAPLPSNNRYKAMKVFGKQVVADQKPWYGLEQEYVIYDGKTEDVIGWDVVEPAPQGPYYCGAGGDRVFNRIIMEEHYEACLNAGLSISGINIEVMPGQYEFQIGPCEGIDAGDQMTIARYLLHRICEKHNAYASFNPKPKKGDWNGSGFHTNFSTLAMRSDDGYIEILRGILKLGAKHKEHLAVYGTNDERLSGNHETSSKDEFTFGVADRGCSIRIPTSTYNDQKGYFEDRRPASDSDPYLVTGIIAETVLL